LPKKNDLERKALKLVFEAGPEGLLQSDMWKGLGATSRDGSRLALKFEEKGAVERKKVLNNGRWTYKLVSKTKLVTLESIKDCPCIVCENLDKCFDGGQVSPLSCEQLTLWMESSIAEKDALTL
jgi:hypothetical protein